MPTAVKTTDEALDFDALESDARERIAELAEQRQRLSLDALTDEDSQQELANVESELASAEGALHRAALARQERDQREVQAKERAEQEARRRSTRLAA